MGNFYVNYTLRGPSPEAVAKALKGRPAIVTPVSEECVVAFDEESDTQDQQVITELAAGLSQQLKCVVLAVMNHDDDILWYQLYVNGELDDEYNSSPEYFGDADEGEGPTGGDAGKLCAAFDSGDAAEVERVLRKSGDEEGYVFEVMRHADLAQALGISAFGVGASFGYITDAGELPEGLEEEDLIRVT
jgi:hypothetical protein